MQSPSSELNAYILDYKARKSLQNSPYSSPTGTRTFESSLSNSKSWLQEVLSMPSKKNLGHMNTEFPSSKCATPKRAITPKNSDTISVTHWLDELDKKISSRFPNVNKPTQKLSRSAFDSKTIETDSDSDKTLELVMADPETGLLDACESYDSHPNMASLIEQETSVCGCDCRELQAHAWVDEVINENLCDSCVQEEINQSSSPKPRYRPKALEQSVNLPEGYNLLKTKTKKKGSNHQKSAGPIPCEDKYESHDPTEKTSPGTETVMGLLARAIEQLQEVKVAVEDNTVSAITISDVSTISQALSELPTDL